MIKKALIGSFIFICLFVCHLLANPEQEFPVLYKGRHRPAQAYARLWLYDFYHAHSLKKNDLHSFHTYSTSPLDLLWALTFYGNESFKHSPLFWIHYADVKQSAKLPLNRDRFTYVELHEALFKNQETSESILKRLIAYQFIEQFLNSSHPSLQYEVDTFLPGLWVKWQGEHIIISSVPDHSPWPYLKPNMIVLADARFQANAIRQLDRNFFDEWQNILRKLKEFENIGHEPLATNKMYQEHLLELKERNTSTKEIVFHLEHVYPIQNRLKTAGALFKCLPSRQVKGEWFSIHALECQSYDFVSKELVPIGNFTIFSDQHFENIRKHYNALRNSSELALNSKSEEFQDKLKLLTVALKRAYDSIDGTTFQEAHEKQLNYPTQRQLKIESLYVSFPWISLLIALYGFTSVLLFVSNSNQSSRIYQLAMTLLVFSFALHTIVLLMRSYILDRPPVSNMFETVVYVPWVAVLCSLVFPTFRKQILALLSASMTAMILLVVLEFSDLHENLDQVQAVLDSQFWLMIHVLLVVGSYGIFALGSIMSHFYLGLSMMHPKETEKMRLMAKSILQTTYIGTTCLVMGTILGGVWAAESWGRFWDWDPKESWAFISICFYLILIHAHRFKRIKSFGLALGSLFGFLAISFTWYGVNYILGTGLHSYGFGSGGVENYYAFLIIEFLFMAIACGVKIKHINNQSI